MLEGVQDIEPQVILGSKLLPYGVESLQEGNAVGQVSQRGECVDGFWTEEGTGDWKHGLAFNIQVSSFLLKNFTYESVIIFLRESEHLVSTCCLLATCKVTLFQVEGDFSPVVRASWMIKGQLVKRELAYHFGGYPLCRRLSRFYVTFNNPGKIQKLEFNSVNDRLSSDSFGFFFFSFRKPHLTPFPQILMPKTKQHSIPSCVFRFR